MKSGWISTAISLFEFHGGLDCLEVGEEWSAEESPNSETEDLLRTKISRFFRRALDLPVSDNKPGELKNFIHACVVTL